MRVQLSFENGKSKVQTIVGLNPIWKQRNEIEATRLWNVHQFVLVPVKVGIGLIVSQISCQMLRLGRADRQPAEYLETCGRILPTRLGDLLNPGRWIRRESRNCTASRPDRLTAAFHKSSRIVRFHGLISKPDRQIHLGTGTKANCPFPLPNSSAIPLSWGRLL